MEKKDIKLGEHVKFKFEGKTIFGKVSSIENGVVNVKGDDQPKYHRPAYHLLPEELERVTII